MSFSSNGIWTVFCPKWFPESLVLHPHGIFKEIFAQAVHMSVSCNVDPLEDNHGWNSKKCCATLFFWIRSLEITNTLEFGFSPFPSLFDLLSKRNNIFFFWNRTCAASILAHLWNAQAYFKTTSSFGKEIALNFSEVIGQPCNDRMGICPSFWQITVVLNRLKPFQHAPLW